MKKQFYRLCGLPYGGYPKGYIGINSQHQSKEGALHWGRVSGLQGRLWIEATDKPATLDGRRV